MAGESFVSIELALGTAVLVLGLRLGALVRAGRAIPDAEARVQDALKAQDGKLLQRELRRLGQDLPFDALASELLDAASQPDIERRASALRRAASLVELRVARKTSQGQALDLVALALASGLAAFSKNALPTNELFWGLGGVLAALLIATVFARGTLRFSVLASVRRITAMLSQRPTLPSLSEALPTCFWCGASARVEEIELDYDATDLEKERVSALLCTACGKGVYRSRHRQS